MTGTPAAATGVGAPAALVTDDPRIGRSIAELDTPVLLLDLDRFERNAARLAGVIHDGGKAWRPHSKGHKSPWIAWRQAELGAIGVTCAKVGEAEVMVEHGITSVLVANQLATRMKVERLARLLDRAEVMCCTDDPAAVEIAASVGEEAGVEIPMLVDVNIGMDRTGVMPGAPGLELARVIDRANGVRFAGIMGYEGHVLTLWPEAERARATEEAIAGLRETAALIEADGIPVPIVSGAGSGNHVEASAIPGLTELQAGGACFMDRFYGVECHLVEQGFEYALTVLATVTSRPTRDRVITDAGFKTLSTRDEMPSLVLDHDELALIYLSAEHGSWRITGDGQPIRVGDQLRLLPDYHDTTTFRHDEMVGTRDGVVEAIIPLLARGRLT
jgi:D-serine deaminase-like pyridoxal phosphate-dependent protein